MDLQFWIWLIAIVAMFLTRALRKSKKPDISEPQPRNDGDDDHSGNKPMTFEELLREIQESKTPAKPLLTKQAYAGKPPSSPIKTAPPIKSYDVDYDDDIEEEEKDYETTPVETNNRSYEIYEKAKSEAFSRPSLEETLKLADTMIKFGHFKEYGDTSKSSIANEVLKDFSDPEGFRKAFIMSEILKRKF